MKQWLFDLKDPNGLTGSIVTDHGETVIDNIGPTLAAAVVEAHNRAWAEYAQVPVFLIIHDRGAQVDHTHVSLVRGHRKEVEAYCTALGGGRAKYEYRPLLQALVDLDPRDTSTIAGLWKELEGYEDAVRQASTSAERVRHQLQQAGATP